MNSISFMDSIKKARSYGLEEFLEIMGELSQESTKKGHIERKCKELITLGIALSKGCNRCVQIHTTDAKNLGATVHDLSQVKKIVLYLNAAPTAGSHLWESWEDAWRVFVLAKGPLVHAHRELIALAVALVNQRSDMIDMHVKAAKQQGASLQQIFEVMPIALLMDGAPALSQIPYLVSAASEPEAIPA